MNKSDLRKRTRLISGFEMSGLRSDPEIDDVNNDVYLAVCDLEEWPFKQGSDTFTTTSGTAEYDLSAELTANIEHPRTVTVEDPPHGDSPLPLEAVTQRFIDRVVNENDTNVPFVYSRPDETKVVLAPTPDSSYTVQVRGWLEIAALADDTDAPVFKERFHPVICYFAAAVLLDEEGRFEESERLERHGQRFLDRMRDNYLSSPDDTPIIMGSRSRRKTARSSNRLWPWRV